MRLFRYYRLWHPASPGSSLVVRRILPPTSKFARLMEKHRNVHPKDVEDRR